MKNEERAMRERQKGEKIKLTAFGKLWRMKQKEEKIQASFRPTGVNV